MTTNLEITPSLQPAAASPVEAPVRWKPQTLAADIATLGSGTLAAGLMNVALVFVLPKLLSVEDYGYWRAFGLYAGYAGLLHCGFADGALLRWAGRPLGDFEHEVRPAMRFLLAQQVLLLAPLSALAVLLLRGPARFVALAVAACALVFNETTILQFALQSAKRFRPAAVSMVVAPGLFLALVLLWQTMGRTSYREVTCFYVAAWLAVLGFLLAWMRLPRETDGTASWTALARPCLRTGWPIVLANTGVMGIVFADRLAVSWAAGIQEFAQYSLAASAMAVPIMAIQACGKVFFSHAAALAPQERKRIYGASSRMVLLAWVLLLPYYFALEIFLRHYLPLYFPSLAYARILLLGVPFLAAIQILQMNFAYLNGLQKRFLAHTGLVLAVSLGATSLAAFHFGSLRLVAAVQVALLGGWWMVNEWMAREVTGQRLWNWIEFSAAYVVAASVFCLISGERLR